MTSTRYEPSTSPGQMTAGLYVIEISGQTVKVGRSNDTDRRISQHRDSARSLGFVLTKTAVVAVPEDILPQAEWIALNGVRSLDLVSATESPEAFLGDFQVILMKVQSSIFTLVESHRVLTDVGDGVVTQDSPLVCKEGIELAWPLLCAMARSRITRTCLFTPEDDFDQLLTCPRGHALVEPNLRKRRGVNTRECKACHYARNSMTANGERAPFDDEQFSTIADQHYARIMRGVVLSGVRDAA